MSNIVKIIKKKEIVNLLRKFKPRKPIPNDQKNSSTLASEYEEESKISTTISLSLSLQRSQDSESDWYKESRVISPRILHLTHFIEVPLRFHYPA